MQTLSIAHARAQLPQIVHQAEEGNLIQFTRRGKPVAVLISLAEYQCLLEQSKGSLLQALNAYQALKEASDEDLSDAEINSWRDKETGRSIL